METLDGRGYEERVWHRAFSNERLHGEWFDISKPLERAIVRASRGEQWWGHLYPPYDVEVSVEDASDDIVDWHIAIHIELASAAERLGLPPSFAGRAFYSQDNGERPHHPSNYALPEDAVRYAR